MPCVHRSRAGRHALRSPCYLETDELASVSFPEAARRTLQALADADADARRLLERVLRSRRNLQRAVADREPELDRLFAQPLSFAEAEQALLTGHSLHPCPKDRGELAPEQARSLAACHAPTLQLRWVAADREHVRTVSAPGHDHASIVEDVRGAEGPAAGEDEVLVPAHPYQVHRWRAHPRLAPLFADGRLRVVGRSGDGWRPTTSVRTLYHPEQDWMAKVSLSVKLTNSLRHLHPEELARGPRVTELLDAPELDGFGSRFPRLEILDEPVSVMLEGTKGSALSATGLAWRANPLQGETEGSEALATLLQDDPRDGEPRLVKRLRAEGAGDREGAARWFQRFLEVGVRPFLAAHGDEGLLFSAHQQNLVLDLDGIRPIGACFRDCQGVGFSPLGRQRLGRFIETWDEEVALTFDRATSATLLAYYLIVNAVFNAIASLAMSGWITDDELLGQLAALCEELQADLRDTTLVDMLLEAPELAIKGNLHYALRGVNETTQERDVLDLYQPIPNPIAEVHG